MARAPGTDGSSVAMVTLPHMQCDRTPHEAAAPGTARRQPRSKEPRRTRLQEPRFSAHGSLLSGASSWPQCEQRSAAADMAWATRAGRDAAYGTRCAARRGCSSWVWLLVARAFLVHRQGPAATLSLDVTRMKED